jgi:hypothetical protein
MCVCGFDRFGSAGLFWLDEAQDRCVHSAADEDTTYVLLLFLFVVSLFVFGRLYHFLLDWPLRVVCLFVFSCPSSLSFLFLFVCLYRCYFIR